MDNKLRPVETEGQMQIRMEAAVEQFGSASYSFRELLKVIPADNPDVADWIKHFQYHFTAAQDYVESVSRTMLDWWGHTDGQLCPNQRCCRSLAFPQGSGWYQCPQCKIEFWCHETDGGIEDYHCYLNDDLKGAPPKPVSIPFARDMGPSWASSSRGDSNK